MFYSSQDQKIYHKHGCAQVSKSSLQVKTQSQQQFWHCLVLTTYNNSTAITKKADRTVYDVRYGCRSEPPTWCCGTAR